MRILIITPNFAPDVGGVETMLRDLCTFLANRGFKIDVITYTPLVARMKASLREQFNEHVVVWRIPWVGFGLFNVFERYAPIQFLYLVPGLLVGTLLFLLKARPRPDIIHTFGLSGAFTGGLLSRIFGIPCVAEMCAVYRLPERPLLARFVHMLLNWSDYVRGNGPAGRQELLRIGLSPHKVGMMEPPVDELIFKHMPQVEARAKIGLPETGFVALFVGRMVDGKGVDLAVAATQMIKCDATFVFVGEGPLRHLVEEAALTDKRICLVNNVPHHDLVYYYNAADILMRAPIDNPELLGFVGREALACGLPILGPNVTVYHGISHAVNPALCPPQVGRLLEPTPEAFATCLTELIDLKEIHQTFPFNRQACRQFALERYSSRSLSWLGNSYQKVFQLHHESAN